ncbi:hypothetical protein CAC42_517 [Sphaceloma murrayae]|uniref:Uncharacterized protein n=1 Tax=Sphaceloma murrayae TaxID=2082308 RepID=A0A2K1R3P9_9PEZI|nr:hypothetical protein CAC42_517 [Sphaceloma murrayae]
MVQAHGRKLTSHRALSLSCYGLLIDIVQGLEEAFAPLFARLPESHHYRNNPLTTLYAFDNVLGRVQSENPTSSSTPVFQAGYLAFAAHLGIDNVTDLETHDFVTMAGTWSAFPDTLSSLERLGRHFKLVVLTNADVVGFRETWQSALNGFPFDATLTADEVGSYKPGQESFSALSDKMLDEYQIVRDDIIHVGQNIGRDLIPAKEFGLSTILVDRYPSPGTNAGEQDKANGVYDWKFDSLQDLADHVERELSETRHGTHD